MSDISTPIVRLSSSIFRRVRQSHWDSVANRMDTWKGFGGYYHRRLENVYSKLITPGQKVLEVGCGFGDLLAATKPDFGLGIDFSFEMVKRAVRRHPDLHFFQADGHMPGINEKFDVIILSDLLNDVWDVQGILEQIVPLSTPKTRLIINFYSRLWQMPLTIAQSLKVAKPLLLQNWLTVEDVKNLFELVGLEVIRHRTDFIFPLWIPLFSELINNFLGKFFPLNLLSLSNIIIARLDSGQYPEPREPLVSVIIPARNEAGNIHEVFSRTPIMGRDTELVFIEGHSKDNTYEVIQQAIEKYPNRRIQLHRQSGEGKGDAVRMGFEKAKGEMLFILDADMSVPPEDLPRFYKVLASGKGEFVNGVRLVYPMEEKAMRFLNIVGNKFFSLVFSWLLEQPIKDTLCGTKALLREDYDHIAANRSYFGDFDPFGDFDLLFGAAKRNLKIVEVPVRYGQRTYGDTNIHRWRHGWLLLKMAVIAAKKIKFN